jgi:uncharacterized membrane protein
MTDRTRPMSGPMAKAASASGLALLTFVSFGAALWIMSRDQSAFLLLQILSVRLLPRQIFLTSRAAFVKNKPYARFVLLQRPDYGVAGGLWTCTTG